MAKKTDSDVATALRTVVVLLFYPIIIAVRIKDEEKLLTEQLEGYAEYSQSIQT